MTYARWSEMSDVYLYESASTGRFICCGCCLMPVPKPLSEVNQRARARMTHDERSTVSRSFAKREQLIEHLQEHIAAGHKVESHAILKLQHEIDNPPEPFDPTRRSLKAKFERLTQQERDALLIATQVLASEDPPPTRARLAVEVITTAMDDLKELGDLGPTINEWKDRLVFSLGVQLAHVRMLVPT